MSHQHEHAIICRHCLDDGKPILLIIHDTDGSWQFLCGGSNHDTADQGALICRKCLFERDASLEGIEILPAGHEAYRTTGEDRSWQVEQLPPYKGD